MKRFILSVIIFLSVYCSEAMTLEDIRMAVAKEYASEMPKSDVASLSSSLNENGQWSDIDYADQSPSLWQLEHHLDRLVDISKAFRYMGATDTLLLSAAIRGLNNWFDNNYTNPNWWYGKIGVPRRMLAIAYLLDENLPLDLSVKVADALNNIDSDDFPARPGGDRIQVISNHAKVLLWKRDYSEVGNMFKKIEAEARIAPYEEVMYDAGGNLAVRNDYRPSGRGVQSDMSFHHRGDRVDSTLTYGLELPEFFAYWAQMLKDTEYAFDESSINFIIDFYLDGVGRHLVAGRYAEPTIMNRELARPGAGVFRSDIARHLLSISNGYRIEELQKTIERLDGKQAENDSYAKYFDQSGYFVFSRPDFQTAVRFYSERNANQEAPHNNEGIRNHFRGDGANMLSVTGREYADIAPVFDFRMIPGATTPLIPYEPLTDWGDVVVLNSPITFAEAACDSLYGAVAFDFQSSRSDLKARKAWFFFDDEYLCLGAGINASSGDSIITTIEQSLSASGESRKVGDWYFHNGNAYHIIDGQAAGGVEHRTGSWNNAVRNVEYADEIREADVFSLAIEHGVDPTDSTYAYAIVPCSDEIVDHGFEILANTPKIQAVMSKDKKIMYVVFYEEGEITTPVGKIRATGPEIKFLKF